MAITTAAGINSTTVTTDQQAPLGFELVVPTANAGEQTWIYVQALGALDQGLIAMRSLAATTYTVVPTTVAIIQPGRIVGVAQHAIALNSYGFVLKRGQGSVKAGNGAVLTVNTSLTTGGTVVLGTALDALANASADTNTHAEAFAWCVVGAIATAQATAMIDCKG